MTSQHNTGTHPFYIGMYIHICTHIYVHIYTSQKECLCIFFTHHDSADSQFSRKIKPPIGPTFDLDVRGFLRVFMAMFGTPVLPLGASFHAP